MALAVLRTCENIAGQAPVKTKTAFVGGGGETAYGCKTKTHIVNMEVEIIKTNNTKINNNEVKTYDFTSKQREFGRVVFALTLDKKKLAERIIIGRVDEVRRLLNGGDGEVYYDEVRPLGSLLLSFESDANGDWNKNHMLLRDSYGKEEFLHTVKKHILKMNITEKARWKMATPVQEFLQTKYASGEPSAIFAAIRTWEEYINPINEKAKTADAFTDKLHMMYKPFQVYDKYKPWHKKAAAALSSALQNGESAVELWYPVAKRTLETVVTSSSFLPLIFYYTHKISEWGYVYLRCKICDAFFLARNRHFELCSDECRKKNAATAKKEFDERAKGDKLEQLDEAAYYYWYNRLRKLRKGKAANVEKAAAFKVEFDAFRKEAVKRKAAVKSRKIPQADFSSWLVEQQELADRLME